MIHLQEGLIQGLLQHDVKRVDPEFPKNRYQSATTGNAADTNPSGQVICRRRGVAEKCESVLRPSDCPASNEPKCIPAFCEFEAVAQFA